MRDEVIAGVGGRRDVDRWMFLLPLFLAADFYSLVFLVEELKG